MDVFHSKKKTLTRCGQMKDSQKSLLNCAIDEFNYSIKKDINKKSFLFNLLPQAIIQASALVTYLMHFLKCIPSLC